MQRHFCTEHEMTFVIIPPNNTVKQLTTQHKVLKVIQRRKVCILAGSAQLLHHLYKELEFVISRESRTGYPRTLRDGCMYSHRD